METAKKRGIVIYDLDINGDTEEIFEIHSLLKEYAEGFKRFVRERNPKLARNVDFEQIKSGVPMAERRGLSGEVKDIVFRGVRDKPNSKIKIPMNTEVGPISPGVHKKLQSLRNKAIARPLMKKLYESDEKIEQLLQSEAEHMMAQYYSGQTPVKYTDGTMKLLADTQLRYEGAKRLRTLKE